MLSRKAAHDRMIDHHANKDTPTNPSKSNTAENAMVTQKTMVDAATAAKKPVIIQAAAKKDSLHKSKPPAKRKAQNNFLLMEAKKAKAARSARTAARVGCFEKSAKHNKRSNTGSGVPLSHVVRLKYVKGFTQAVSTPCRLEDLV
jgi:hypothetical protein